MNPSMDYPIQMICAVSTSGNITPMRFRYEDTEHKLFTVNIDEVLAHNEIQIAGATYIIFTCSAVIDNQKTLFKIKYTIPSHQWIFIRRLN